MTMNCLCSIKIVCICKSVSKPVNISYAKAFFFLQSANTMVNGTAKLSFNSSFYRKSTIWTICLPSDWQSQLSAMWLGHWHRGGLGLLTSWNLWDLFSFFFPLPLFKCRKKDPAVLSFNGFRLPVKSQQGENLTHHTIKPGSTWETEIIFTLYSPLTGLIIARDRCAQGLESITIHPWTMINDPMGTTSERPLSNSVRRLICHQTQEHALWVFSRPCPALQKVDKKSCM